MKASQKREILFNLFSGNLSNFLELTKSSIKYVNDTGEYVLLNEPAVFCPLCTTMFTKRMLDSKYADRLTIEHVPPESVGGQGKVLTCKICNDTIGQKLDHHIQKALLAEPFLKKIDSTIDGRIRINDNIPLKAKLSIKDGRFGFRPQLKKGVKYHYHKSMNELKDKWDGAKLKVQFWSGNPHKSNLALLKSAYLEMFNLFGHQFLFSNNSARIREQINNPSKEILPHSSIIDQQFEDRYIGIHIIKEPIERMSYLVIMKLKTKSADYTKTVGVLLPGPGNDAWDSYSSFANDSGNNLKLTQLGGINCIREKEMTLAFSEIWSDVKGTTIGLL